MPNAEFDYHRYLSTLQAHSLNYTRLFGGIYIEVPGKSFGILRNDLVPQPGRYVAPWAPCTPPPASNFERLSALLSSR